jgi:hypothetical protein
MYGMSLPGSQALEELSRKSENPKPSTDHGEPRCDLQSLHAELS